MFGWFNKKPRVFCENCKHIKRVSSGIEFARCAHPNGKRKEYVSLTDTSGLRYCSFVNTRGRCSLYESKKDQEK